MISRPVNIVLLEPEMPANTGNIGRTCVATGSRLHLIEPLGFRVSEKTVKRAGLDYWEKLDVTVYDCYRDFLEQNPQAAKTLYMASTKAPKVYTEVSYEPGAYIMFGKESAGIPEELLAEHKETTVRIPMLPGIRSLNLANSVAVVLYEVLRQNGFSHMQPTGEPRSFSWEQV
ncbi:MAG: tRNA (cytidine(34)-2'-O)-methyltransferase [Lachnospiraceae bacterium]|nr:tRNA (cytidine(34)-2'-O)-methyltransferase [Lachnospiraceae bacterium]